jgi:signal transduction histidine kinase
LRSALTLRLAGWYFALSAAGAIVVVLLTHAMLAQSLRERDRDAVRELTVRYARIYERGGLAAIERAVAADRMTSRYEPFFLRIARGPQSVLYLTVPHDWPRLDESRLDAANLGAGGWIQLPLRDGEAPLDVSGIRLLDGTELQVGKSSRIREEALARFRARTFALLGLVFVAMFAGGVLLTHSALAPLRAMIATIERLLRTGNLRTRVRVRGASDPLESAAQLFNQLLDRLERLMTGMRQMLDNTAHDLRTPLTRARARVESALLRPGDAAAQTAALERTLEDIDRIDHMLTTLMDISEAEAGAMRLTRTAIDAAELLEETRSLFADSAEARGLRLTAAAPAGLAIEGDRDRLRQVLANVVDNAIKYTPEGGSIHLDAAASAGMIDLRVADTGRGIPADELPRIWERSFRGDQSRSERGYGLGLSLVKAIVDAHGGTVAAESKPGEGATFTLSLPRAS